MRKIIAIASGFYLVIVGVFIGATNYENAFNNVKWTDIFKPCIRLKRPIQNQVYRKKVL
ncbi:hypothetical protein VCRA2122O12_330057 [Vibrio crassostreae]|nr:hypothetical protein VCRA2117O328_360008 [Vibrio crassostreae]CAK2023342.1 hypothetical protein VCRA2114E5_370008 [Vibrio crassostreae]CAK2058641.1 hypothetical protein VCRA2110O4_410008 [Vibrio crassostreae]CAK2065633.1 hypothetical protein VCRA2110O1_410005 [Vibrio crassostreae]CAK2326294.1 hypothetical protein VCRA2110O318_390001 [Vibrio crassostreae]